ncbi:MAG: SGNH/GDSL hydrolase family protein [Desulfobacterales bacterium]|nr:SGNH/GDSL hydrolase family protein [Desulfobacterales bacterium]
MSYNTTMPREQVHIFYVSNMAFVLSILFFLLGSFQFYKNREHLKSKALLVISSILMILVISDFYIILFRYDTSGPGGPVLTHKNWYNRFVENNELGFWERSVKEFENKNDRIIIAAIGDSFTWGQGIKGKRYRFTERLERKLNQTGLQKNVLVLNFGNGGESTSSEINIIRTYLPKIKPDIVFLCYLSNDIRPDDLLINKSIYYSFIDRITQISPTINFFYWKLIGPLKYRDYGVRYFVNIIESYRNAQSLNEHINEIGVCIDEIKKLAATPIFVFMPFPQMWEIFRKDIRDLVYSEIRTAVKLTGTPIIDLTHMEKEYSTIEFQVNSMDAHPNEKMHEIFAETIYKWIIRNALIS